MIEYIAIRNFQSHRKLRVEFDPLVTTFVGPTDIGKSAIIRALGWVVSNRPSGKEFIRHGSTKTSVAIGVDGRVVKRVRGTGVNLYYLDDKKFQAFGTDVPEEIRRLFNVSTVSVQEQLDSPFWLTLPASQVSKELNQIVDLGVIDRSLSGVASRLRKSRIREQVYAEEVSKARQRKKELAWAGRFSMDLEGLVTSSQALADMQATAASLSERVQAGQKYRTEYKRLGAAVVVSLALAKGVQEWEQLANQRGKLAGSVAVIQAADELLRDAPVVSSLMERLYTEAQALKEKVDNLKQMVQTAIEFRDLETKHSLALEVAWERLQKVSKGRCPTCGSKLAQESNHDGNCSSML